MDSRKNGGGSSRNGNRSGHESIGDQLRISCHPGGGSKGEKRGRDQSEELAGPSSRPDKIAKQNIATSAGKGKRREEFVDQPVTRPTNLSDKRGEADGDMVVKLKANFFKFQQKRRVSINVYRLDFTPTTEIFGLRRFLVSQHRETFGGFYVYDGSNQLYLMTPLQSDPTTLQSTSRDEQNFTLTLKNPREIQYTEAMFLQVYNLVVRNAMRELNLQLVGRNLYDANAAIRVQQHRLEIWPGYINSVRQHEQDLLLCCEISHKVMRNENVHEIIRSCLREGGDDYRVRAAKKIVGSTILTRYNNKTYRISDIDWSQNPLSTFPTKDGERTFAEYYRTRYNIDVRDNEQPLLVSKAKARDIRGGQSEFILLVPELCDATGLTDEMRSNFTVMRDLSQHTRLTPQDRVKRLNDFNQRLQRQERAVQVFQENFITLDRNLVEFDGRRLKQEVIEFGNDETVDLGHPNVRNKADWTRDLTRNVMYTEVMTTKLRNWFYVFPSRIEREAGGFLEQLKQAARGLCGSQISDPNFVPIRDDNTRTYLNELEKILTQDPSFILIVVPNNRSDRYGAIKIYASDRMASTQIIVERTLKQQHARLLSIATKVAIQINCKLGGIPWMCDLKLSGMLIVGFSVTHDTNDKRNSYGAMVASLNPKDTGGYFFSTVLKHYGGEQLSNQFGGCITTAIRKYTDWNDGALPKRILIYRDGVGDGQIQHVIDQELNDVKHRINLIYKRGGQENQEKIGFVIVNKRTNTRLFVKGRDNHENPLPGTVVDDVITLPERYDFYLVSPSTNQGSVSPTYYNVIHDEFYSGKPHIMQALTFKFCHLYYNWSGTTCVPSVVQYAKKLALLVGQHLHKVPNSAEFPRSKQLYFL